MKTIFKYGCLFIVTSFFVWISYINIGLYYSPTFTKENNVIYNNDVYKQLQFLKIQLRNGEGEQMQSIYPEGFVFINALYGLSWASLIENLPVHSKIYKEGIEELNWSVKELLSPQSQDNFDETLHLKYGAFYMGWSTYVLGKKLSIQPSIHRNVNELELFKKRCRMIAYALENQESPFLESYDNNTWPADGVIAVSALNLYNKHLDGQLQEVVVEWLGKVKLHLNKTYGLIPHYVNIQTGESMESVRGSSQSLMLNFLYDIDRTFAKDQFNKYEALFLDSRLGLIGIREYPKGITGYGDIDSGPVIWDIGGAASIVGQRTFGLYGKKDVYTELRNNIEVFGVGYTQNKSKSYLFGKLPMMDAFFAWSNALESPNIKTQNPIRIKWKFHFVSLCIITLLSIIIFLLIRF